MYYQNSFWFISVSATYKTIIPQNVTYDSMLPWYTRSRDAVHDTMADYFLLLINVLLFFLITWIAKLIT